MATDAQINANRQNAAKSTGPKTEKGKSKARGNALKHGGRAKTIQVMPVLPHEDPRELEERITKWIDDWEPRDATESELVAAGRGCRGCWSGASGPRRRTWRNGCGGPGGRPGRPASVKRVKKVNDLGRKLFYEYEPLSRAEPGTTWDDEPAVYLAGLEATIEGCRWLLDRWGEIRTMLECDAGGCRWTCTGSSGCWASTASRRSTTRRSTPSCSRRRCSSRRGRPSWSGRRPRAGAGRDSRMLVFTVWREFGPRPADKPRRGADPRGDGRASRTAGADGGRV